jgi:HSP20 family protein
MFLVPLTRSSQDLARSFDRLFDDSALDRFFNAGRAETTPAGQRSPALDVAETERSYTVKVDLPGIGKDDVKIAIDGRRISIEAQTERSSEKKDGERVIYTERSSASYARSFTLPSEVDQAESSARMDSGVLTLTLAKRGASKATQLTVS